MLSNVDPFELQLAQFTERIASFESARSGGSLGPDRFLPLLEELHVAAEELRVANEELRTQESELEESVLRARIEHERYRDLFMNAPDAYIVTDIEGTIREANRAASQVLNVPATQLVGKPFVVFVESERAAYRQQLRGVLNETQAEWILRLRPRRLPALEVRARVAAAKDSRGLTTVLRWILREVDDPTIPAPSPPAQTDTGGTQGVREGRAPDKPGAQVLLQRALAAQRCYEASNRALVALMTVHPFPGALTLAAAKLCPDLAASLIVSVVRDGHETVLVDCSGEESEANGENVFRHEERLELMDSETFVLEARWRAASVPELRRRLLKQFADAAAGRFQLREM